jgi:MFS family permease
VKLPLLDVFRRNPRELFAGILVCLATFVLFYLMIVFTLSWGTKALHYSNSRFLTLQLFATLFFAATIPVSAWFAEYGRRRLMIVVTIAIAAFGFVFEPLFTSGLSGAFFTMSIGLSLMGITYGPLGTLISELFPTPVRYTGSSLAFSTAGILGASAAPYIATKLAMRYGLHAVGYYLTISALLTLVGLLLIRETKDEDLNAPMREKLTATT